MNFDPSYRLECLKLAIMQASPNPAYVLSRALDGDADPAPNWSAVVADEVLALAQRYADFLENGGKPAA